jgi:predicted metal-dependent phosphoesterase TrpH
MCTVPVVRAVCRESYNQPLEVYAKLKRLGMDLVTITDHDSIDAVEVLRSRPDFFLSEEVTCTLPSGGELHVGVYDISDQDHIELQRRRDDFESLLAYLAERDLFFSANHVFSSLTGRRRLEDFALFESAFPALETRNGHMLAIANNHAAALADFNSRAEVGGSDAHTLASVGCAYTVVRNAHTKQEYLAGLRRGLGKVRGETGGYFKLTRDVFSIAGSMMSERPVMAVLAPVALAIPVVTMGNYVVENIFARWWMARYLQMRTLKLAGTASSPVAEAA